MHAFIKDNYLNLDDVLVVSAIENIGNEGAKVFHMTIKGGKTIEFLYHRIYEYDVRAKNGNFIFGTDCFFYNAHKEILNKLTNATELPKAGI